MTKLGYLVLALSLTAAAACGGDDNATTPTASGVFPAMGFAGRNARIEVSGDATTWDSMATVSFGDGITVNKVTVASPTDLFADVTIDPTAMVGPRDVTVTDNGTFTLTQAFQVISPVAISFQGDAAQAGLPYFTINNLDFDNQFDPTTDANGEYTNVAITGPSGTQFQVTSVTSFQIQGYVYIDADAQSGPVTIASGPSGSAVMSTAAATIMPRSPTAITAATTMGSLANPGDSQFYSLAAAAGSPSLVHFAVSSSDANAAPVAAILPSDGHWAEILGVGNTLLTTAADVDIVVFDGASEGGYNFTLTGSADKLTTAAEGNDTANNDTAGALDASALPFEQTGGTLSSDTDVDVIKVTVPNDGMRIHVVTDAGNDPYTDTQFDVTDDAGNEYTNDFWQGFGSGPIDESDCSLFSCTSFGENATSDVLAAGTYYVTISAGLYDFDAGHTAYTAILWLE